MCRAVQPGVPIMISMIDSYVFQTWVENREFIPAFRCEVCADLQTVRDKLIWLLRFVYIVIVCWSKYTCFGHFNTVNAKIIKKLKCRNKLHCNSPFRVVIIKKVFTGFLSHTSDLTKINSYI
jgi:hypothetical protein